MATKGILKSLPVSTLIVLDELQMRQSGIVGEHAEDLSRVLKAGKKLPRVEVRKVSEGKHKGYLVTGGFHTVEAHVLAGRKKVPVVIREGTWQDAKLDAGLSNQGKTHQALKPTVADRQRACEFVLEAHPEWSNRRIADEVGIDDKTVKTIRDGMEAEGKVERTEIRESADGQKQPAVKKKPAKPADDGDDDGVAKGDKPEKYDWKNLESLVGHVVRAVEGCAKFHGDKQANEYLGARRILTEFLDLSAAWKKRHAKQK